MNSTQSLSCVWTGCITKIIPELPLGHKNRTAQQQFDYSVLCATAHLRYFARLAELHAKKAQLGTPLFLNVANRRKRVAFSYSGPFNPGIAITVLGGPQTRSGRFGEHKNLWLLPSIRYGWRHPGSWNVTQSYAFYLLSAGLLKDF